MSSMATRKRSLPTAVWNRWSKSSLVYLGLLFTASTYSNWQPLFLLLDKMGSYTWMCDNESTFEYGVGTCDQQYDYLSQIFSVANNMSYVMGLFAGFLVDIIGNRVTMSGGVLLFFLGWLCLLLSSQTVPLYWVGMIFLGCAENFLGFPGFSVGYMWPKIQDTTASICIAMQMLSSWVPVVLWAVVESHPSDDAASFCIKIYLVVCALPVVGMILATPGRKSAVTLERKQELSSSDMTGLTTSEKLKSKEYWMSLFNIVTSPNFIMFTVWYIMLTLGNQYYNTKIMAHAGQEIGEFVGYMGPFRALIGPVMGSLSDVIGPFPMLILDNLALAAGFGLALIPTEGSYYASAVLYIISRSFCFTTKYIFVQHFYPKEHFGKLNGIISILGGSFGFLNAWFQVLPYETQDTFTFCLVLSLVITVMPIYLMIKARSLSLEEQPTPDSEAPTAMAAVEGACHDKTEFYYSDYSDSF